MIKGSLKVQLEHADSLFLMYNISVWKQEIRPVNYGLELTLNG